MNETQSTMKKELEDALGEPVSDDEARRAVERPAPTRAAWLQENRLLVLISGTVVVVLGAMASLLIGSFWVMLLALAVHLLGTLVVATLAIKLLAEVEKPDPVTVARLEAAGMDEPEQRLNMAIRSHGAAANGLTEDADVSPDRAAAQAESNTPAAGVTELVGPGSSGSLSE